MNKINVFGVDIAVTNLENTYKIIDNYNFTIKNYICFPDSSVIVKASKNPHLRDILNNSYMTLPDGKPLELYARFKKIKGISTVSGYWLCQKILSTNHSHFFYGGNRTTIKMLETYIKNYHPNAQIKGFREAPYFEENQIEVNGLIKGDIQYINKLKPDLIWIGISSPKQDYLMHTYIDFLDQGLMLGIGGVFDYLSGTKTISPEWIKKIGFRWFYRLLKEPKRLWRKYLFAVIGFIYLLIKEIFSQSLNFIKPRNW